jgi:hypothetical protein
MRRVLAVPAVLACLLVPATAAHASARDVVRDCTDNGRIDSPHSPADYKGALHNLPSDVDEYTDCRQIIEAAQRRDAHSSSSGGGGGTLGGGGGGPAFPGGGTPGGPSPLPQSPAEKNAIANIGKTGGGPVTVAGQPVVPGGSGITSSAFRHSLPAPLIVLLVLLGLGALAWAVTVARARGINPPVPVLRALERVFPRRA